VVNRASLFVMLAVIRSSFFSLCPKYKLNSKPILRMIYGSSLEPPTISWLVSITYRHYVINDRR